LQGVDLRNVFWIVRVNQGTHADQDIAGTNFLLVIGVGARVVFDIADHILILVDHLHRPETLARIGQGDRHRTRVEVEHR